MARMQKITWFEKNLILILIIFYMGCMDHICITVQYCNSEGLLPGNFMQAVMVLQEALRDLENEIRLVRVKATTLLASLLKGIKSDLRRKNQKFDVTIHS